MGLYTPLQIERKFYRRGDIKDLGHHSPESFIQEMEGFVSLDDDKIGAAEEEKLMSKHSCFSNVPCNPLFMITNL